MTYVGDGNNVCNRLMLAAVMTRIVDAGGHATGYEPDEAVIETAGSNGSVTVTSNLLEAVSGARCRLHGRVDVDGPRGGGGVCAGATSSGYQVDCGGLRPHRRRCHLPPLPSGSPRRRGVRRGDGTPPLDWSSIRPRIVSTRSRPSCWTNSGDLRVGSVASGRGRTTVARMVLTSHVDGRDRRSRSTRSRRTPPTTPRATRLAASTQTERYRCSSGPERSTCTGPTESIGAPTSRPAPTGRGIGRADQGRRADSKAPSVDDRSARKSHPPDRWTGKAVLRRLAIDGSFDGTDLLDPGSPVHSCRGSPPRASVAVSPRVGMSKAADTPWRFEAIDG